MMQEQSDEGALPGHELLAAAVEIALHQRRRRDVLGFQFLKLDLDAPGAPPDLVDDRVRQRLADRPEVFELLLDPGDAVGRRVLPDVFIVLAPAFAGLVQAAHERGCGAVRLSDYAGLPMKEWRIDAGDDANLDVALLQNFVKTLVPRAPEETLDGIVDLVPALLEELLAGLFGGVDVLGIQIGVADDPHLADGLDLLVDEVEDRGSEIAGDAEIFRGAVKSVLEVDMGQALAARREPGQPAPDGKFGDAVPPRRATHSRSPEAFVADQAVEDSSGARLLLVVVARFFEM